MRLALLEAVFGPLGLKRRSHLLLRPPLLLLMFFASLTPLSLAR